MSETVKVFETQVTTWGVEIDKYGKFKLPVALGGESEIVERIESLASENGVEAPLYGKSKTLYLRPSALSAKQKKDLLNKGRQTVKVKFEFTGMYKEKYMCFKVLRLGRVEEVKEEEVPEDY